MGSVGYSGWVANPTSPLRSWESALAAPEETPWRVVTDDQELFLRANGLHCHLVDLGSVAVMLRGLAVRAGSTSAPDSEAMARHLGTRYLETGTLEVDDLEGSFTVALLDAQRGRLLLYRNLVGNCFTYYTAVGGGLVFAGNLSDLVGAVANAPTPNAHVLPAYFLFRFVPGRETLFDGFYRLMPGEELSFENGKVRRRQRHTFADLCHPGLLQGDAANQVEATLSRVLADYGALQPSAANLLSGGVDSSLIQILWNKVCAPAGGAPSFSIAVNHESTETDTQYALSAAQVFDTRHTLVAADMPYADHLCSLIGETGEPPNHVQAAYFGPLARVMVESGHVAGLCGEGADSLFGTCFATGIQHAELIRRLLPSTSLRRWVARLAGRLNYPTLSAAFGLANNVNDLSYPAHPVNRMAVFADESAVRTCFGTVAIADAFLLRRNLARQLQANRTTLDAVHAVGYLGESIDSAALWTAQFNREGGDLFCPFLDSRILKLALSLPAKQRFPFRQPKGLLRRILARYAPRQVAYRSKRGFGQPIFEWMAPGGQLRPLVEQIGNYDFLDRTVLARSRLQPNWFLYSLLCYDLWHKKFIQSAKPTAPAEKTSASTPTLVRVTR